MTLRRLTQIGDLSGPATPPAYTPADHGAGIVHLGFGAFHRAHQAAMTDDALAQNGGDWRIIGVSMRSRTVADHLNAQNGLFTLIERGTSGTSARVIGAVERVIAADPAATLQALCEPGIRLVTLTVTEKGYGIDVVRRLPDTGNPVVAADLASPADPRGVLGLLVAALRIRRDSGLMPFTILSCDNLPENGRLLHDGVVGFARMSGQDDLADWIAATVAFPSSMVDRITPAATQATYDEASKQTGCVDSAAIETEPFTQWVIEDRFTSGRPGWEAGGALFVPDVTPYEHMKLSMLNGSHSMLAYAGFLSGQTYVRDVMSHADLARLVHRHLNAAAALLPSLPGVDLNAYAAALADRFTNPAIAHETFQIATDGTQKLPQRIFKPALVALERGKDVRPFAFATAMWMRFCMGQHDDGTPYTISDPRAAELIRAAGGAEQDAAALSQALHDRPNLIPARLAEDESWRGVINDTLTTALRSGCSAAIRQEAENAAPIT